MPTRAPAPRSGVPTLISAINDSEALAADRLRPDLIERLANAKQRIESRSVTVAVVGEFKRGKSTLVNAVIQTSACPVDADIVTAVPTLVKYGEKLAVTAYLQRPDDPEPTAKQVGIRTWPRLVSEAVDEARTTSARSSFRCLTGSSAADCASWTRQGSAASTRFTAR